MYDLFINNNYLSSIDLIIEAAALLIFGILLFWLLIVIFTKRKVKNGMSLQMRTNINLLWALVIMLLLLTIYMVVIYIENGAYSFHWADFSFNNSNTYFRLLPQLLLFIGIIITYIVGFSLSNKIIKK